MIEAPKRLEGTIPRADHIRFVASTEHEDDGAAQTWYARGQNFVVAYSQTLAGARMTRIEQPDEYVMLLIDPTARAEVHFMNKVTAISGRTITFIPPGASEIYIGSDCRVIRLFTARSQDMTARAANAASYATPRPSIPPFEPWPAPSDGFRVRVHSLDLVDPSGKRIQRVWRCSTFMVNFPSEYVGPRDANRVGPHVHDDFEQCCLAVDGEFVTHIRYPWSRNRYEWLDDEHAPSRAPAMVVVPPKAVHCNEAVGPGINQLLDVFCPPRVDFALKPGFVRNADEYPLPPFLDTPLRAER